MSTSGDYKQQHLIKMANQIASSIPTREDIPGQISAHMRQFWTSEMLKTLREIAAETPDILSEDVHSALQSLSSRTGSGGDAFGHPGVGFDTAFLTRKAPNAHHKKALSGTP